VPAAAVIPAPIAYIKVVAVKKLVVESQFVPGGPSLKGGHCQLPDSLLISVSREGALVRSHGALHRVSWAINTFTLKKLECSKQALL
jgi:hypothetical protein